MPNDNGKHWKEHANAASKRARAYIRFKACKTCKQEKNIKEFAAGGGTYYRKDNCRACSPDPETWQHGSSKVYRDKSKQVRTSKETYIPSVAELTRSVIRITDQEQVEIDIED